MKTSLGVLAALVALGSAPALAQSYGNWRVVGYKTIDGRDSDTIQVPGDRRFRQIKLCAYNAPLRMRDLDVRFHNGDRQDVSLRDRLNPGTCTRNIDLEGNRRDITSVRMKYEPLLRGAGRPLIRVQAR